MECTTCHNPHGSQNVKMLREGNSITEACATCHAEKRGPFLWEHAAGRENCVTCHDPHGSNNERMLVAKLPMLCQRCHVSSRHPATIYDEHASEHQQEQPGRRPLLRQLPPDDSWLESSDVRHGVHPVRQEDEMRTRTMILIGALLASAALAAAQDARGHTAGAKAQTAAAPTRAHRRPGRRRTCRLPHAEARHG